MLPSVSFFSVLLLQILCHIGECTDISQVPCPYREFVDENYEFYWNFNTTHILFQVTVKTNGYIGFGLSGSGAMYPSDVIIGWVDNEEIHFADRHATGFFTPLPDASQDWFLLNATESGQYTSLTMIRKLDTCDSDDMPVTVGTTRIIYSYHPDDPVSDDVIQYHGGQRRGTLNVNLLEPSPASLENESLPSDAFTIDFLKQNYSVPSKATTYSCNFMTIPDLGSKHHMIKIEPLIQKGHELLVHHIIVYYCSVPLDEATMAVEFECYSGDQPKVTDFCQSVLIGWAIGGRGSSYPEVAGYPLGGPGDPMYFRMEIHYDNPGMRSDFVDSSGLRITLTKQLRQYDAGLIELGVDVYPYQIIPPFMPHFLSRGFCHEGCLSEALGDTEIHILGNLLHAHLLGRKIRVRHIRNGTELPFLQENAHYDFNFQESTLMQEERILRKGDSVILECEYDSSQKSTTTFGGLSTSEEMCLTFLMYYPRMPLTKCESRLLYSFASEKMGGTFYEDLEEKDWKDQATVDAFLASVQQSQIWNLCQSDHANFEFHGTTTPQVNVSEPYTPPNNC